jgi:hypothetical protein
MHHARMMSGAWESKSSVKSVTSASEITGVFELSPNAGDLGFLYPSLPEGLATKLSM